MDGISVIGLGKLGACTAACFAAKGFSVIGVDCNRDFVDHVNNGKAPVCEPRLQELISLAGKGLRATDSYGDAIDNSDVTFLIVPTPSRDDGRFSNDYLRSALEPLSAALRESTKEYHLFVITSTVSPGSTEADLIPLIERTSGRKLNQGFGVCYNPEFIALGSVVTNFLNPDMVLIGESDAFAGCKLEGIYSRTCNNRPVIARMSIVSAEITKISLNSYITMKISFANTLANICEAVPGADIDHITSALGADKRIAPSYLKGGTGYGGPCFPRDNHAFSVFAEECGIDARLAKATDEVNNLQVSRLVGIALKHMPDDKRISVLGLAYKIGTPVIEESPAIRLIEGLLSRGAWVTVYDPLATDNVRAHFGARVQYASSVKECFSASSLCILTTPLSEFESIDNSYIEHRPTMIVDCWRVLDSAELGDEVKHLAVGKATR